MYVVGGVQLTAVPLAAEERIALVRCLPGCLAARNRYWHYPSAIFTRCRRNVSEALLFGAKTRESPPESTRLNCVIKNIFSAYIDQLDTSPCSYSLLLTSEKHQHPGTCLPQHPGRGLPLCRDLVVFLYFMLRATSSAQT